MPVVWSGRERTARKLFADGFQSVACQQLVTVGRIGQICQICQIGQNESESIQVQVQRLLGERFGLILEPSADGSRRRGISDLLQSFPLIRRVRGKRPEPSTQFPEVTLFVFS